MLPRPSLTESINLKTISFQLLEFAMSYLEINGDAETVQIRHEVEDQATSVLCEQGPAIMERVA